MYCFLVSHNPPGTAGRQSWDQNILGLRISQWLYGRSVPHIRGTFEKAKSKHTHNHLWHISVVWFRWSGRSCSSFCIVTIFSTLFLFNLYCYQPSSVYLIFNNCSFKLANVDMHCLFRNCLWTCIKKLQYNSVIILEKQLKYFNFWYNFDIFSVVRSELFSIPKIHQHLRALQQRLDQREDLHFTTTGRRPHRLRVPMLDL